MAVLVALHKAGNQVPDAKGSVPHLSVVVALQRLLLFGRTEEGDVVGFV